MWSDGNSGKDPGRKSVPSAAVKPWVNPLVIRVKSRLTSTLVALNSGSCSGEGGLVYHCGATPMAHRSKRVPAAKVMPAIVNAWADLNPVSAPRSSSVKPCAPSISWPAMATGPGAT